MLKIKKLPIKSLVFILCTALAAGTTWILLTLRDDTGEEILVHRSPVIYESFDDAAAQADAVMAITITSQAQRYEDFGGDGKPDYDRQPGLPVELLTARVDDVLQGDSSLTGETITFSQTPPEVVADNFVEDYMVQGKQYVVIAFHGHTNPGVGGKSGVEAWNTPLAGQGVFTLSSDGLVFPSKVGVFPELFGYDGKTSVTTHNLQK